MRFGLQIPNFTAGEPPGALFDGVVDMATAAEESGFDSVWVMDHFYQLPPMGGPSQPMLESYTLLGALAARTVAGCRLGAMVTGVTYRNPAHLAKIVTTLDVISAGRAILGIGAAWYDVEHEGWGSTSRRPASGWTGWRRRCRSAGPCSPRSAPSFDGPLLPDPRGAQRAAAGAAGRAAHPRRRAAARSGRCNWWRATPT